MTEPVTDLEVGQGGAQVAGQGAAPSTAWDPGQYARFANERSQPFFDLAALVEREAGMRVVDLGCGDGELTAWLHRELGASDTLGVDAAPAMLERQAAHAGGGVRFEAGDIRTWQPAAPLDLVFSNAALQWVEGHEELWPRLASWLAPGGQLAIQMPMNDDHVSHATARELAAEAPYAAALEGYNRRFPTLTPERYAELLYDLGFARQHVRVMIYPHVLTDTRAIVEWVKGSMLTPYRERLAPELYARFLEDYSARLVERLGERAPFFYSFRRILMWGRRG